MICRYKGVDSRLVYFEDEAHWVTDPRNSLRWHREIFAWLDKYLGSWPRVGGVVDEEEKKNGLVFQ